MSSCYASFLTMMYYWLSSKPRLICFPSADCGPPVAPQNGFLESYTGTTEGSEVFYSCNPGLVPERRMRAVCTVNGWTPNPRDLSCTLGMLLVNGAHVPCMRE